MDITPYLKLMVEKDASDLYFSAGAPVNIRVEGVVSPVDDKVLTPEVTHEIAVGMMREDQARAFARDMEMDLAVNIEGIGRFRVNIFQQRGNVALVVRYIKARIPTIEELNLPPELKELVLEPRGLILVVGTTGCGKSTTLAAMIEHRNQNQTGHILTIEDPIEYVHEHAQSIVNQREVGMDTVSYATALRRAMREAPDVILIGEIRDRETMEQAIAYAETGHLCLSTLHATNANHALERIINFYPEPAHQQVFMDLAINLRAVISQRLVTGVDGKRLPAVEMLLNSPYVADLIQKGEIENIKDAMEQSDAAGMQTFDQVLYGLYAGGRISKDEALRHADSRTNLSLRIRLEGGG